MATIRIRPENYETTMFLGELNLCPENAFEETAQNMIDSLLYANMLPKMKRSAT